MQVMERLQGDVLVLMVSGQLSFLFTESFPGRDQERWNDEYSSHYRQYA